MTDITRYRGDTYADVFTLKNAQTKQPLNLTGHTFVMTLDPNKAPTSTATNLYSITGTILDAAAGTVEFAPSSTQANNVGKYFYDIQMVDGQGRKRTILTGKYTYTQDIGKI